LDHSEAPHQGSDVTENLVRCFGVLLSPCSVVATRPPQGER